jgi:BMFP domain-containing protein YqiC
LINNLKFKRDDLIDKLELVSREEFNVLKKIVEKQQSTIDKLNRKKKTTKVKKF